MGKLSPENRLLVERVATEIAAEYWLAGYTFEIGPLQLNRLLDAARSEAQPSGSSEVERDMTGETVCGFRVAAWRETHPEHGDKYGWKYSEHWSTPSSRNPAVRVERLFTEAQLRAALTFTASLSDASPKPAEGQK